MIVALLVLLAAPQFDTSTITASRSTIHPLETIDYTVTVRNTGDSTPSYLRVANAIPNSAMFVSASPDWKYIEADRELSWMGALPPGASKVLTLTLIARPESAGLTLANRAAIHYDGAYRAVDHDLQIDSPPNASDAAPAVVGYVGFTVAVLLAVRRRQRMVRMGVWLILLSGGFLLIFGQMALRDSRLVETQCTIVDSMTRYHEARQIAHSLSSLYAVRYLDTVSAGFGRAALPRDAEAPCWYDPREPRRVVLSRDAREYAFAAIPLGTLALGIFLLFGARASRPR